MTTKIMSFLTMTWFLSTVICIILEGTYLGAHDTRTVIDDLSLFTTLKIGGLVPIPAPNIYFFRGVFRLLTWDYSFYEGGYAIIRYFWMVTLSPGIIWAIGSTFAPVFANFLRFG